MEVRMLDLATRLFWLAQAQSVCAIPPISSGSRNCTGVLIALREGYEAGVTDLLLRH